MANFKLGPDENVILKAEHVKHGGKMASYSDELVLTNENIILVSLGMFGKVKNVEYYPVNMIKIYDGEAQAKLGKDSNGTTVLDIYFKNGEEAFGFQSKGEIIKWVNAINRLLLGDAAIATSSSQFAIPGSEAIAETLKGTIDTFKGVFGKVSKDVFDKMQVSAKCSSCGASIIGMKGKNVKCPYCGSYNQM